MTEFGSLSLVEKDDDINKIAISLPGVVKGDHSARSFKPEIQVTCVKFSPTARSWCACSTEGLLIYSIDSSLIFDPFDLDIEITPKQIRDTLFINKEYSVAIMQSFRLNEEALCSLVLETVPYETIDVIVESLPDVYVDKLLSFISNKLEKSPHLEFYLLWAQAIIYKHANRLKQRSMANMGVLCNLEKSLTKKYEDLGKM
jgi:periodic tryptophan protein 2